MAYALSTLVQILNQDEHPLILANKPQIQSLLQKASSLIDSVAKPSLLSRRRINNLESRIRDAAHMAEDIIETYITDQVHLDSQLDLMAVMTELDSITEALKSFDDGDIASSSHVSSFPESDQISANTSMVVGFDGDVIELLDQLTSHESALQVIPVVGMAGIGKTTLARELYHHRATVCHFDSRAWVTISQEFNLRCSLLALLNCLVKVTDDMLVQNDDKLGHYVHYNLMSRRYFIVVDDIWDTNAWDRISRYFPDCGEGSRVLVTTREGTVAQYVKCAANPYQLMQLDDGARWELLAWKVFGPDCCPDELVETGRKIAHKCVLPLGVVVMAGILAMSDKTLQFWEFVEKNVSSVVAGHDSRVFEVLAMSYNYLPYYLKPCFLYVGAFPEDFEIRASKIIKLWIAEGCVKPVAHSRLEDTAEAYLKSLTDANLLSVCNVEADGRIKTFKIHDLLREFCRKKASDEKFLCFRTFDEQNIPENTEVMRRVSVHPLSRSSKKMESMVVVRSFLCIGRASLDLAPMFFGLGLLRVLDVFQVEFHQFPREILELINLRLLAFSCYSDLPSSMSRFRNLQTLVIRRLSSSRPFSLPSELWGMKQLQHIKCKGICIWHYKGDVINEKLQTLTHVQISRWTQKVIEKLPSLTKLGIVCDASLCSAVDLSCLHKLEKLKCSSRSLEMCNLLSYVQIPSSLKKLTLSTCKIPWEFMTTVGSLPNLEQLKLQKCDFIGPEQKFATELDPRDDEWGPTNMDSEPIDTEWKTREGEFVRLSCLLMEDLNLVHWSANSMHFPQLQRLVIRDCCSMEEIPHDIGEIDTLELIEVDESSPSVRDSAMEIQQEQRDVGNDLLQVIIHRAY